MSSSPSRMFVDVSHRGDVVFSQSSSLDVRALGGGKAANLAFLDGIRAANVPLWGFVSHVVFRKIFSENSEISQLIDALNTACKTSSEGIQPLAEKLRGKIRQIKLTPQTIDALRRLFREISENETTSVAVRSSATTEDAAGASFAGLFDSVLNQRTFDDFLVAIKIVWASVFSDRSVKYHAEKELDLKNSAMGVIIQKMIVPRSSGTAFTLDVATGYQGINILSNFGVEGIVGGEPGDSYLFTKDLVPLRRMIVPKTTFQAPLPYASGVKEVVPPFDEAKCESMSLTDAQKVAVTLQEIAKEYFHIYRGAIDTEFCITPQGEIHFLQIRPVTDISSRKVYDLDPSISPSSLKPIAEGQFSVCGVSQGKIKVIASFSGLESKQLTIEPDDIVVAHRTANQWSQFFTRFKGIITMEGTPTAHPMILAREHGVPCVIGVKNAVDVFLPYDGQTVTLDGFRKKIYLGALPTTQVPLSKISEMFEAVKPLVLPQTSEYVEEAQKKGQMFTDDRGKVWLVHPATVLSGSLLQLQLGSFPVRSELINQTGVTPPISLTGEQQVIGSRVYEKLLGSLQEQVTELNRLTLEQFESYSAKEEEALRSYLQICQTFTPTVEKWRSFCDSYRDVCAYMWLSFITRTSKLDHTFSIAHQLGIPKIYFAECEAQIQASAFEEDVAFKENAIEFRNKLLEFYREEDLQKITVDALQDSHHDVYEMLLDIGRKYKFSANADWKTESQPSIVLKRLLDIGVDTCRAGNKSPAIPLEFFSENQELLRWMVLGTKSKIQQNNNHHQRIRGQWLVREKLVSLGQTIVSKNIGADRYFEALDEKGQKVTKKLLNPTDILDATVDQVEKFILEFQSRS